MEVNIRPARLEDAASIVAFGTNISNEFDSNVEMSPGEFQISVEEEEIILQDYADSDNSIYLIAEYHREIVGILSCRGGKRIARRHVADLSMSVHKAYRGQGIGTRLLSALMEWVHENPLIKRIELGVFERNQYAIHLYEKFGFVHEGRCRNAIFRNCQYLDTLVMAYLVDESDLGIDTLPVNCY
jgi:RimJ/RimL family protein N-acetyltransferase